MTLSLRQIRNRIKGIESTRKITRAMEMVSSSKLGRARRNIESFRPFCDAAESLLREIAVDGARSSNKYLHERAAAGKAALCVVTSDSGLCSTYNSRVIARAEEFVGKRRAREVTLVTVGRKGFGYFRRRGVPIYKSFNDHHGSYSDDLAKAALAAVLELYDSHEVDEVHVAYTSLKSASRHVSVIEKFLNVELGNGRRQADYIFEPDHDGIISGLMPLYLSGKMRRFLAEAFVAEHFIRMVAMRTATDNASELMNSYITMRNKARQAAITKEIIEIVSAAEALRG
jgi:F-type H+-transporting ATPase subunit gamma